MTGCVTIRWIQKFSAKCAKTSVFRLKNSDHNSCYGVGNVYIFIYEETD